MTACSLTASGLLAQGAAAQCGERLAADPSHWTGGGPPPLVIGDSVLYEAVPGLARLGFQADAMVCRQFSQGLAMLQARAGSLPHLVVLALGTNGSVTIGQIDAALAILGPNRLLALVTPHHGVVPSDIQVMYQARAQHPRQVTVLDWNALGNRHPSWFGSDGIHLTGQAAINGLVQLIASVLPYACSPPCPSSGQAARRARLAELQRRARLARQTRRRALIAIEFVEARALLANVLRVLVEDLLAPV